MTAQNSTHSSSINCSGLYGTSFLCLLLQNKVHFESWKENHWLGKWLREAGQPALATFVLSSISGLKSALSIVMSI